MVKCAFLSTRKKNIFIATPFSYWFQSFHIITYVFLNVEWIHFFRISCCPFSHEEQCDMSDTSFERKNKCTCKYYEKLHYSEISRTSRSTCVLVLRLSAHHHIPLKLPSSFSIDPEVWRMWARPALESLLCTYSVMIVERKMLRLRQIVVR